MPKRLFYRRPLLISTFGPIASIVIVVLRWMYVHRDDPDFNLTLANYAVAWLPEPAGFTKPAGINEGSRYRKIPSLNPGAFTEKMTIVVKTTLHAPANFPMGFTYSCKTCGKFVAEQQRITVFMISAP